MVSVVDKYRTLVKSFICTIRFYRLGVWIDPFECNTNEIIRHFCTTMIQSKYNLIVIFFFLSFDTYEKHVFETDYDANISIKKRKYMYM